jgi:hypothetical protein
MYVCASEGGRRVVERKAKGNGNGNGNWSWKRTVSLNLPVYAFDYAAEVRPAG